MINTSEDMQVQASKSSGFGTRGTTQEYLPMNELLLSIIYQVKMVGSLIGRMQNSIMKYHSKVLVSNICHIEFITCIGQFTTVNILGGFPIKKDKQQQAHIRFQLNSGKT